MLLRNCTCNNGPCERKIGILIFLLFFTLTCRGQDSLYLNFDWYKESSLSMGYNYSFSEPNDKNFHLVEVRYQVQRFGGIHPAFKTISTGLDIGLNTGAFLIGPRIGGVVGYGGGFLGADIACYTDFSSGTFRLIPFFGFGFQQFRISINPHVRLSNKGFEPIDRGHLNLTVRLFKLKQKRLN